MPRSMFPEKDPPKQTERSLEWKRVSKDQEGSTSRITGGRSCPSELLKGLCARSTWQVADVRRLLVSVSHITQAENDFFFGKGRGVHHAQEEEGEIGAQDGRESARA